MNDVKYNLNYELADHVMTQDDFSKQEVIRLHKEKIENYASIRLDDILREENGLFTVPDNTVPGVEGIQIQGLSSDYVQILVDGVPSVGRLSGNLDLNRFAVSNL